MSFVAETALVLAAPFALILAVFALLTIPKRGDMARIRALIGCGGR